MYMSVHLRFPIFHRRVRVRGSAATYHVDASAFVSSTIYSNGKHVLVEYLVHFLAYWKFISFTSKTISPRRRCNGNKRALARGHHGPIGNFI